MRRMCVLFTCAAAVTALVGATGAFLGTGPGVAATRDWWPMADHYFTRDLSLRFVFLSFWMGFIGGSLGIKAFARRKLSGRSAALLGACYVGCVLLWRAALNFGYSPR